MDGGHRVDPGGYKKTSFEIQNSKFQNFKISNFKNDIDNAQGHAPHSIKLERQRMCFGRARLIITICTMADTVAQLGDDNGSKARTILSHAHVNRSEKHIHGTQTW